MGSPVSQNRQGRSAAVLTPTRGPRLTRGNVPAEGLAGGGPGRIRSGERGVARVHAVLGAVDAEGLAQPGRAAGQVPVRQIPAASRAAGRPASRRAAASGAPSMTRPARSSTAVAVPSGPADQVDAEVHAVGEVHVARARAARTSPRCARCGPGRSARPGRRSPSYASTSVSSTATSPSGGLVLQHAAQQPGSHLQRGAREELPGQQGRARAPAPGPAPADRGPAAPGQARSPAGRGPVSPRPRQPAHPRRRAARSAARPPGPGLFRPALPGGERPSYRQHLADVGRQVR